MAVNTARCPLVINAIKKQIHEELLETVVAEVITKLVSNPKFAALMQQKISMKVDTSAIEQEIANVEIHQIQAADHIGRYGNKFGQQYTSRDGSLFVSKNRIILSV